MMTIVQVDDFLPSGSPVQLEPDQLFLGDWYYYYYYDIQTSLLLDRDDVPFAW